jgi:ketol-acid reductoisomerase
MKKVLSEIQSGEFAEEWLEEARQGAPRLLDEREVNRTHPIEIVGRSLRGLMPFLTPKEPPR